MQPSPERIQQTNLTRFREFVNAKHSLGTAEIYRQVEALTNVQVILFVKMAPGMELTEALKQKIKKTIRENTTPRHVPAKIIAIKDIPYT